MRGKRTTAPRGVEWREAEERRKAGAAGGFTYSGIGGTHGTLRHHPRHQSTKAPTRLGRIAEAFETEAGAFEAEALGRMPRGVA